MALVRCILGKFLGIVCHCFPHLSIYSISNLDGSSEEKGFLKVIDINDRKILKCILKT
jgi:hypothetical protein